MSVFVKEDIYLKNVNSVYDNMFNKMHLIQYVHIYLFMPPHIKPSEVWPLFPTQNFISYTKLNYTRNDL